jgi:hypothetical protein
MKGAFFFLEVKIRAYLLYTRLQIEHSLIGFRANPNHAWIMKVWKSAE